MKPIEKKHRETEKKMQEIFPLYMPVRITEDNLQKFEQDMEARPELKLLNHFTLTVKNLLAQMYNEEVGIAAFEYKGWYHNTILNMSKHWYDYEIGNHYRTVIANDMVRIELKETSEGAIELWTIEVQPQHRNKGIGTQVMTLLQDVAEVFEIKLLLVACSQGEPSYNEFFKKTLKLREWYYELGFEYVEGTGYMHF